MKGGVNKVMEYVGPALEHLTVYERATICNMTQELGATSGLFPSDEGPNIVPPPPAQPLPERLEGEVLLRLGDSISTDEILPGGNEVLPLRSNIPAISEFTFAYVDATFAARAKEKGGGFIVAGENYGQGSSREHAAIAPMYLGIKVVLAKSYARIHESNLVNFGIPPLRFTDPTDYELIEQGDALEISSIRAAVEHGVPITIRNLTRAQEYRATHTLSPRQIGMLLAGGLTRFLQARWSRGGSTVGS